MKSTVIDVSRWQGAINWYQVKASGVWGVIIKAGGSDDGFYKNPFFEANYNGAKAAGMHVGAYYFVGPACTSAADGAADAKRFIGILKDKVFDLPVYIDFEAPSANNKAGNTQAVIGFGDVMEKAGYYCGVYASDLSGFQSRLNKDALKRFSWWVARYGSYPVYAAENCHVWQYTSSGHVGGISGSVDMDLCYKDFPSIIKTGGYNGYTKTEATTSKPTPKPTKDGVHVSVDHAVYRLYNPNTGDHLLTADADEVYRVSKAGWTYEGVAFLYPADGTVDVYRLKNPNSGEHLLTADAAEKDGLVKAGWKYEGVAFKAYTGSRTGTKPVRRLKAPKSGMHITTMSDREHARLSAAGWTCEGVSFYALPYDDGSK